MNKIPLIIIGGPTASGKTGLSINLALKLNGEIVSADSMQIYRGMNIGSAKPTFQEMQGVPHYMIDIIDPGTNFSVAEYSKMAHEYILDIYKRGKTPIVCGGTGLYINSLMNDIDFDEHECDLKIRQELTEYAIKNGNESLHKILEGIDHVSAESIHMNNVKRVVRAIEFYKTTGIKISEHNNKTKIKESRYETLLFSINHQRQILYDRINKRVDKMIDDGLINEVESLMLSGVSPNNTSMQAIGYKEISQYILNQCTLNDAIDKVKMESRRYAKRQLTWFRRYDNMLYLEYDNNLIDNAIKIIKKKFNMEVL